MQIGGSRTFAPDILASITTANSRAVAVFRWPVQCFLKTCSNIRRDSGPAQQQGAEGPTVLVWRPGRERTDGPPHPGEVANEAINAGTTVS